jgi:hypothetical protein
MARFILIAILSAAAQLGSSAWQPIAPAFLAANNRVDRVEIPTAINPAAATIRDSVPDVRLADAEERRKSAAVPLVAGQAALNSAADSPRPPLRFERRRRAQDFKFGRSARPLRTPQEWLRPKRP